MSVPDARRDVASIRVGYFRVRLVRGGFLVPARICRDERGWWGEINGLARGRPWSAPHEVPLIARIWEYGREIDEGEYNYLLAVVRWARENEPTHPILSPEKPIDPNLLPPVV